jgi:L-ascorbate metabolism protein UlaG (beta-lactamase superfamily)
LRPGERVTYLGHASVLVELAGMRILTDPVLRSRVMHLRRRVPVPDRELLADLDAVLVSHAHHDHLDVRSLRLLPGSPPVIAPPAAGPALGRVGLEHRPLREGSRLELGGLAVSAVGAAHDGGRWPFASEREAVGYLLEGGGERVYFAGDTDLFEGMEAFRERTDVALLPVAGWGSSLGAGHLDPESAARAAAILRPRIAVPIHWGTYTRVGLEDDPAELERPARRFLDQLEAEGVRGELLSPGESLSL